MGFYYYDEGRIDENESVHVVDARGERGTKNFLRYFVFSTFLPNFRYLSIKYFGIRYIVYWKLFIFSD